MHKKRTPRALPALIAVLAAIFCTLVVGVLSDGGDAAEATSSFYGTAWSLLPPVIAIVLALITKEVYSSLFVGILIFLVILGAMVSLMNRAGGSAAFGRWAAKHIKTRVGAQLATIVLGILIFVDDYFNCLTVGSVMRPVTDKHGVVCVSACMAGAVCGDHCSPISDTTIMASAGAQCDHVNHVSTQLPYAITCAAVSCVSYIIAGFVPNAFIALPVAIVLMLGTLAVIKAINERGAENDA